MQIYIDALGHIAMQYIQMLFSLLSDVVAFIWIMFQRRRCISPHFLLILIVSYCKASFCDKKPVFQTKPGNNGAFRKALSTTRRCLIWNYINIQMNQRSTFREILKFGNVTANV